MAKLADFGLSQHFMRTSPHRRVITTIWWRAPEVFLYVEDYSYAVDIWSLGILAYEIFFGDVPTMFKTWENKEQLNAYFTYLGRPSDEWFRSHNIDLTSYTKYTVDSKSLFDYPDRYVELKNKYGVLMPRIETFINSCLQVNPGNRPTATTLLNNELFVGMVPIPDPDPVIISPGELKLLPVEMTTWATHIQKELKIYDDTMVLAYDLFFDRTLTTYVDLDEDYLYLILASCMSLACKLNEFREIILTGLTKQCKLCEAKQIIDMEITICDRLDWRLYADNISTTCDKDSQMNEAFVERVHTRERLVDHYRDRFKKRLWSSMCPEIPNIVYPVEEIETFNYRSIPKSELDKLRIYDLKAELRAQR